MTTRTKTLTGALAFLALAPAALVAQQWNVDEESCDDRGWRDHERVCELRSAVVPAAGRLVLDGGPNGGVEVVGESRSDVAVTARPWAHAESESRAREILSEIRLTASGGRFRAEGPRARGNEGWGVSWELRVPRESDVDVETTNGGVTLRSVRGDIDFRTTNGGVLVEELAGDVRGHTTNGGVEVHLDGDAWDGEGLDVSTTNGGVELYVPEGYSARLETGTTNGDIDLDFPVTVQGRIGRTLETVLGDGGPTVRVTTTNGGVRLIRR